MFILVQRNKEKEVIMKTNDTAGQSRCVVISFSLPKKCKGFLHISIKVNTFAE